MMARRQVERPPRPGREVHVPQLLEIAAEITTLALEEQVDAVARKDLGDPTGAEVDDAARPPAVLRSGVRIGRAPAAPRTHHAER